MGPKTLICDADGTLLNSWEWMLAPAHRTLAKFGINYREEDIETYFLGGIKLQSFYEHFAPKYVQRCLTMHRDIQKQEDVSKSIVPYPGVERTLEVLYDHGVRLGIATSRSERKPLLATLQKFGINQCFGPIVCLQDVQNAKPDPESVLHAMELLGAGPKNTFFVGDTVADMEAGKAAGVTTIAALYGFGDNEEIAQTEPNYSIDHFSEVIDIVLG